MSQALEQNLAAKSKAHAEQVGTIASHVRDAISHTRSLARGLSPVTLESEGLMSALASNWRPTPKRFFNVDMFPLRSHRCRRERSSHRHASVSHRAGGGVQCHQTRQSDARLSSAQRATRTKSSLTISDNGVGLPKHVPAAKGNGPAHHAIARRHDWRHPDRWKTSRPAASGSICSVSRKTSIKERQITVPPKRKVSRSKSAF